MVLNKKPALWLVVIAFACTYLIWGTTYMAILIGIETLPPFLMAAIRFLVAGIALLIIAVLKGENIWARGLFRNMLLGIVILSGGQGLLAWAELYIPSGYAAILVSTLPLWYVLLDRKNWNIYFKNKVILAGLLLGFGASAAVFVKVFLIAAQTTLNVSNFLAD